MRFIFFSCPHFKLDPPAMRKPDYGVQILQKLSWVQMVAKKLDSDIVCLGDLFDKKQGTTIREMNQMLECILMPFYMVLGNHDIQAYNPDIETQPVGLLVGTDKVILAEDNILFDLFDNGRAALSGNNISVSKNVIITCENYHAEYEVPETYNRSVDSDLFHIHCTHGMLTKTKLPYNATDVREIDINADIIVNGHNHEPWEWEEKVYNVGSLARIAKDKNYLNKQPKVLFIDTEKNIRKWIDVPVEKDVWIDEIRRVDVTDKNLDTFIKSVQEMELSDDSEMLDELLKGKSDHVKEKAYNYLESAKA